MHASSGLTIASAWSMGTLLRDIIASYKDHSTDRALNLWADHEGMAALPHVEYIPRQEDCNYLNRSHCMAAHSMDRQVDLSCSTALVVSAVPLWVPAMAAAAPASSISDRTYASEMTCTTSCRMQQRSHQAPLIIPYQYVQECEKSSAQHVGHVKLWGPHRLLAG